MHSLWRPAFRSQHDSNFINAGLSKKVREWLGISGKNGGVEKEKRQSAATKLIELAEEAGVTSFHSAENVAYAVVPSNKHNETWPIKSTGFRRWLARLYYTAEEKAANAEAVANAINTMEGFALFDGEEILVHVRIAGALDKIYLDLADDSWRVIEVSAAGWRILTESPIRFIHPRGLLALPEPQTGGSLDELRPFVNVKHEDAWRLLLGFLFGALHPFGPYPILAEVGEQGSAKTTLGRLLRSTIDPNKARSAASPATSATWPWPQATAGLSRSIISAICPIGCRMPSVASAPAEGSARGSFTQTTNANVRISLPTIGRRNRR